MSTFVTPDYDRPLDAAALIAQVPADALVKGMFFHGPLELARKAGGDPGVTTRYLAFKDYTVREHMDVLVRCAQAAFPGLGQRGGLRKLGHDAYLTFAGSLAGKAIFAVAARDWDRAITLVTRSYGVVGNKSSATVLEQDARHCVLRLSGVWNFPDCYHVGVFEGAMQQYQKAGEIKLALRSASEVDYLISWQA